MLEKLRQHLSTLWSSLEKEDTVLRTLDGGVRAAVKQLAELDPAFERALGQAYAYAVFPSVGKATALLGCSFGKGEVFQGGGLVGYAAVAEVTVGVQVGGDTFIEIVIFKNRQSFERFKSGAIAFAAGASAVLIKAGAATAIDCDRDAAVFVHAKGGIMLEIAIGVQKFFYRSAGLGRLKAAPRPVKSRALKSRARTGRSGKAKPRKRPASRAKRSKISDR